MKKITFNIILLTSLFFGNAFADNFGKYGFVINGSGDSDTLDQRTYEWEQYDGGCYCFHAAGSTAINIRTGRKSTDTKSVYTYFDDELNAYKNKGICETGAQDWLNSSNRYHIPDLNIYKRPGSGYFSDIDTLWGEIKSNVDNNKPMFVMLTHYSPIYSSQNSFTEIEGYRSKYGHAVTIVGYIDFDSTDRLVAVRDPAIDHSDIQSDYDQLFDYTLSIETLDDYLQERLMLVFATKVDADLKTISISVTYEDKVKYVFDTLEDEYGNYFSNGSSTKSTSSGYYRYYFVNGQYNYLYAYNKYLWYKINENWSKSSSIDVWYDYLN